MTTDFGETQGGADQKQRLSAEVQELMHWHWLRDADVDQFDDEDWRAWDATLADWNRHAGEHLAS